MYCGEKRIGDRVHRFFVEKDQIVEDEIEIVGLDVKHIKNVLRLRIDEEVEISCDGYTYVSKIKTLEKNRVLLEALRKYKGSNEPPINIILYQGLAKGNKMDVIFQKGTEVGVSKFYPVETNRSIVKINNAKKEKSRIERWTSIVDGAAKQSKRDIVPKVENIINFKEMIALLKDKENILVPYENEDSNGIKKDLDNISGKNIHLIIGPEGGFDPKEIEDLKEIGAKIVTLGPRILRTETAGLVASSIILYELGDLGVIS